jgi:dipeptidyl aminopeptidase/acylaminoacyl peptidase
MRTLRPWFIIGCGILLMAGSCIRNEIPLLERQLFFGNPDKTAVQMSADGKHISYLAPLEDVLNVYVAPADNPAAAAAVTADKKRGIRRYFWSYSNQHIIYLQDDGGDENWAVHVVDIASKEDRNLTPIEEILDPDGKPILLPSGKKMRPTAFIQEVSRKFPAEILIGLNNRDPQYHDLYRLNLESGGMKLIQKNDRFAGYLTDDDYNVRFALKMTADGGTEYLKMNEQGAWEPFIQIAMEDMLTTALFGFDKSNQVLYMVDSRGRNTAALSTLDLKTGRSTILMEDPKADINNILIHPTEKTIEAAAVEYTRTEWKILDAAILADITYLKTVSDGDWGVADRTLDDKYWIVSYLVDNGPVRYYLYDRAARKASFLFTNRTRLEGVPLARMHPVVITSRDGLDLVSYLTLPVGTDNENDGRPDKALPMVLYVHGGPWGRDSWGLNGTHQWLANRGYAVLSVNFRASTGFGKDFINAGNLEWAGKMHNDLIDAVNWAVQEGIARKDKIAIMGGSYGGYATLVGLTFTPEVFACGVDIVGPSNLRTLLETIPPYWKPQLELFTSRVGDHRTVEGRAFLEARSPLSLVSRISKPLLIGQGANDPRVKQSESDQIVKAMQEKNIPVTYVLYSDEGHGFARPENRLSFYAISELFFSRFLGGRSQPIGKDFSNSSLSVPVGAAEIPTLSAALPK